MGVIACDRSNCGNVMCDKLILDNSAYICHSCWDELLAYKSSWPETTLPAAEIKYRIENFMRSPVGTHRHCEQVEINEEFRRLTEG